MNKKEKKSNNVVKSDIPEDIDNLNISLNVNSESPDIMDFITVWKDFRIRPNKHTLFINIDIEDLWNLLKDKEKINEISETYNYGDSEVTNTKYLVKLEQNIWISFLSVDMEEDGIICQDIHIFYKEENKNVINLIKSLKDISLSFDDEKFGESEKKINTFIATIGETGIEYYTSEFVGIDSEHIQNYYNENCFKSIKKLIKKMKSEKGLIVFSGERGNGKTSIISYLSENIDRNFINIPINMIDNTLSNSQFRSSLKKMGKITLVIDDCEFLFNSPIGGSNIFSANVLQLVDGLSSLDLDIQVLVSVNIEEFDDVMLDSNNLISHIEFKPLDEEESNELSKHLKNDKKFKGTNKVIDIVKGNKVKEKSAIGF